jgi:hypothetical protein
MGMSRSKRTDEDAAPPRCKPHAFGRPRSLQRRRTGLFGRLVGLTFLLAVPLHAAAQTGESAPTNAHARVYGDGWECDWGYQEAGETCVPIKVPQNAYLDSSLDGWECERGYRKSGESCVALVVPANAHIGYSPNDWTCNPGYRRQGNSCRPNDG